MATGHRVNLPLKKNRRLALPREVEVIAPREYVDRWGIAYRVIWNDRPGDPSLLSTCWQQSSAFTYPTPE